MTEPGGNCELVLLQQIGKSLLASVEANDCDLDDADLRVRTGDDDERPAAPPLRVLSVRLIRGRIEVTVVVTSGAPPHHLVKELEGKIVSHFFSQAGGWAGVCW